ncbi:MULTISPECIES: bifunctional phosphoribosyl-AMP cyclohydrolase/phosphoribosyl-ATP diphosphatase HisIE [Brevibacillus]|uniref:bifunctional phosphoribosyl-AMP cyclohydrolase/phosphoribosyl-ATP diphosphatase HisIE n=1 Tax=Brevibacillus TaxID=55080 RepID=UPI000D100945|nr:MULTISPECIES: bifunctional phosphoribosyl-AMP cyclohydrolase/phosphoribosyl-ATP diphosphatase HisIE [Brevibacillus]PSJ66371.1 bifunctional phosphoribosyl-AMP cyclohydrolase/phosphoribosyl-ATP pyrophosphatase [Brevibacillus brevis]RED21581.1 phosphoribosyl-ATP pyrophosphatase /phosphoribosyl-AMP cyclohydrolase [Brevibacillus brevis]TQK63143.1 phosphoribosyl-ATP pyrophosphatase /phosphoribosyl-AMP cyclohydrolase [Brevibacillus sp. AG162]VEF86745.1 Phosphoribosyl-ATP pyrophosphatase [Brevibacil
MTGAEAFAVEKLRFDEKGLIPVIVQDAGSKTVLTLAYMNEESLQKSLATKETWFWSRSRQQLWHKGETSGHIQRIVSMRYDCDGDALVVMVEPNGPACHTGAYSCFSQEVLSHTDGEPVQADRFAILGELEELIAAREAERPEGSYTTYLFEKGVDKILKKVGEETAEVIIAAKNRSREELRYEASDLIFHLMVLLREQKLPLDEVLTELQRRR